MVADASVVWYTLHSNIITYLEPAILSSFRSILYVLSAAASSTKLIVITLPVKFTCDAKLTNYLIERILLQCCSKENRQILKNDHSKIKEWSVHLYRKDFRRDAYQRGVNIGN